jgi:hypothetical protein
VEILCRSCSVRTPRFPLFGAYVTHNLNAKTTYLNQWNLSIQRQVGSDWLLTINYLGNNTIHLWTGNAQNPAIFLGLGACNIAGVNYSTCSTTTNQNQRRALSLQNPTHGQYYAGVSQMDDGGTATYDALFLSAQTARWFQLPAFPLSGKVLFRTARSGQGRADRRGEANP